MHNALQLPQSTVPSYTHVVIFPHLEILTLTSLTLTLIVVVIIIIIILVHRSIDFGSHSIPVNVVRQLFWRQNRGGNAGWEFTGGG
jgi:hypothetical protein